LYRTAYSANDGATLADKDALLNHHLAAAAAHAVIA
jgi:hypothetical protein